MTDLAHTRGNGPNRIKLYTWFLTNGMLATGEGIIV